MIQLEHSFLRGSYPPLITPFRDGAVEYETFARLVEYQIHHGSHGIVVCGTTAEPSTLTTTERMQLVKVAIETAAGRVPVVAATGSQSHEETVTLTVQAEAAGADAVLIVPPPYIKPPQRGLVEYYTDVGRHTGLPLLIYHIPGRTAVDVQLDTIERIAEQIPHLVGIKHAVNDLAFVSKLLARFGFDFRIFVGLEELSFPMLAIGAAGMMNAVGNLAPRQVAELFDRVARGDLSGARRLHFELFELNQAIFFDTNPIPLKYMMKRSALLANNEHRLPMVPATAELEQRLDGVLQRAGLL
ncbi:MAG TPA: 4-hydroxy-tetrahydrodipicolinate synthase [Candidatus Kryptonia bacterium]|nr:4-hydroxy-tetrahydrodipicolinate synthase [Candidatus Kryptonia bacterium]